VLLWAIDKGEKVLGKKLKALFGNCEIDFYNERKRNSFKMQNVN